MQERRICPNVTFPDQKATFLQNSQIWARPGSHDQTYRSRLFRSIWGKIRGNFWSMGRTWTWTAHNKHQHQHQQPDEVLIYSASKRFFSLSGLASCLHVKMSFIPIGLSSNFIEIVQCKAIFFECCFAVTSTRDSGIRKFFLMPSITGQRFSRT